MTAIAKNKSIPIVSISEKVTIPVRRHYALQHSTYEQPSDDYKIDHILHAYMGLLTGGISPTSIALARLDWATHIFFSPTKHRMLHQSFFKKIIQFSQYAVQASLGINIPPVVVPATADQRFKSEGWKAWPFNVFAQGFLLQQDWWKEATSNVRGVSNHHSDLVSFAARQWMDTTSPSNFLLTNPDILQITRDKCGQNFWNGYLNWLDDMSRLASGKKPAGSEAFEIGTNLAATRGQVVYRNDLIELIQYKPATAQVHAVPVLIVPAWIMKYYILDLSPDNSLVKYLVDQGYTVFMISWKNPDADDRDTGLEDYLNIGLGAALKAVKDITGAPQIHATGYCLGGTLLSMMAAAMARDADNSFKTITLLAAQTDFKEAGEIMLFADDSEVAYLEDIMWNQGYLDKSQMAGAFQMLRSNDLIWSHIINDYLRGERQPLNDLMAWNADTTRMPYRMHSEYLHQLFIHNDLAEGRYIVKDKPIALRDIRVPLFSVGTLRDHVAPWQSVYKIQLQTDSDVTFVLTSGGHNAGIISEPGHKGRSYQISTMRRTDRYIAPGEWQSITPSQDGSWWQAWLSWLDEHSEDIRKPPAMGNASKGYPPIEDAPGQYVFME